MDSTIKRNFLELPALEVKQPLGTFYVVSMLAKDLLSVSFSEPLKYIDNSGSVQGSQRVIDQKRLESIATYIDSVEMAFPNSIIIAANYTPNGTISKDESERWQIVKNEGYDGYKLIIPKKTMLAAIIDGQHRVGAFSYIEKDERRDAQLLCSIYFDLPNSYQAFLFATINSNQKKVSRSLALDQFGYNVNDEPEKAWTPEKFAVFISRKLNIDANSPFYQHVKVAPLGADKLFPDGIKSNWVISTASIVDGICSLISSNPKRDRIIMQQFSVFSGRSRSMIKHIKDVSPLRDLFIEGKDQVVYDTIVAYFNLFNSIFWKVASEKSYIYKTIGVQAAFDLLKMILVRVEAEEPNAIDFNKYLLPASKIDFSDKFFQASGIGRSRIRNSIALAANLVPKEKIKKDNLPFYEDVLKGNNTHTAKEQSVWEENAENKLINILEKAQWNYDNNTVSLYEEEDYENAKIYSTYLDFIKRLIELSESAYAEVLPSDVEFADQQKENFDAEDLVLSSLNNYEPNLKKLGWIK